MNTTKFGASMLIMAAIATPAAADDSYYDTARVLSVVPQTERINTPRQDCHTEYERNSYYNSGDRDVGGAIIGSIAGGLLGSQVGKGKGRIAGAAIGAATGAIVGDRIDNSGQQQGYSNHPVERCTVTDNWQTVTRNYLVTYRYNGRIYSTTMANAPGDSISLRVSVVPEINSNHVGFLEQRDNGGHRGWGKHRDHDNERWDD